MTFKRAVHVVVQLAGACREGLQAFRACDRGRVLCAKPRRLKGSINMDDALVGTHPQDPRWDYGLGYYNGRSEEAIWIEVHPASSDHVSGVIRKAEWLRAWLRANAVELLNITGDDGYVWLSAGSVSLQRSSRQARQLAQAGVSFPRKRLELQ